MIFESWLIVVNVRLKPCEFAVFSGAALHRKGAAKTPCKCGSLAGFLRIFGMDSDSPILSIPGISYGIGSMIVSEIGDFSRFDSPDKILAYAGCFSTSYQSGQLYSSHAVMEKRGSRYLRWALINAARYVCNWEPTFAAYLEKKRSEGKHYYVALSHAAKKFVRLLYHLETTGEKYIPQTLS